MTTSIPLPVPRRHALVWVAASAVGHAGASAACRPIRMPLSAAGALVQVREGRFVGLLPEVVTALERRLNCPLLAQFTPRARQVRMFFETHEADIFWPAVRHPRRDALARFSPLFRGVVQLVTRAGQDARPRDANALLAQRDWQGALVSGYSFGTVYDDLVRALNVDRRVTPVRDVSTALRMVAAGRVQFTLLTPMTVYGESLEAAVGRYEQFALSPLQTLPMYEAGAYVSQHSMSTEDQDRLLRALDAFVTEGDMLRLLKRHYPAEVLAQEFCTGAAPTR